MPNASPDIGSASSAKSGYSTLSGDLGLDPSEFAKVLICSDDLVDMEDILYALFRLNESERAARLGALIMRFRAESGLAAKVDLRPANVYNLEQHRDGKSA